MFRTVSDKGKELYNLGLSFRRELKGEEIRVVDISCREAGGKGSERLDHTYRKGKEQAFKNRCLCVFYFPR